MPVRSLYFAGTDVLTNYIDNSLSSSIEGRTMSHVGLTNPIVPISMIGFMLLFFLPGLGGQGLLPGAPPKDPGATLKEYSGVRVKNDSLRQVYYHDQTIAIVELGPGKELLNCELVEVYQNVTLALKKESISSIARPILISFNEMQDLMQKCQQLSSPAEAQNVTLPDFEDEERSSQPEGRSPLSLFSGIMPGTKWCGTGDIANTYFDLGEVEPIDRCCRTHDLCPAKVRAFQSRYNLTNYSLYTKSHCACDSTFYDCLKATNNPTANLMGNLYFNIVRVPCVEDIGCEGDTCERKRRFRGARKHF